MSLLAHSRPALHFYIPYGRRRPNVTSLHLFFNNIPRHGPLLDGEADAGLHDAAAVGGVAQGIAPVVDLVEGVLRRAVDLELHHVDRVGHEDHHVGPSLCGLHLRLHVDVEHGEDEIERPLVEALRRVDLLEHLLESLDVGQLLQVGLQLTQGQVGVVGVFACFVLKK